MCELFGYSGYRPTRLSRWLLPFRERGGGSGDNPDGWGVAVWQDGSASVLKSPEPGWRSERFMQLATGLTASLSIAHVRKARHPPVPGMLNTHPFAHDCCGRQWVFAHNGLVPEVVDWGGTEPLCRPDGETDSEHAFCQLLTAIADAYESMMRADWVERLERLSARIASLGKFNFLLSDGQVLIAYGHDRLHYHDGRGAPGHEVVIATEPLTEDRWQAFAPGEMRVYRDGRLVARLGGGNGGTPC